MKRLAGEESLLLPHDQAAEEPVLGAMLVSAPAVEAVLFGPPLLFRRAPCLGSHITRSERGARGRLTTSHVVVTNQAVAIPAFAAHQVHAFTARFLDLALPSWRGASEA